MLIKFPKVPAPHWPAAYVGTPWQWGGRDVGAAIDCWGLLLAVYEREFGLAMPDYPDVYQADTSFSRTRRTAEAVKARIQIWEPVAGPAAGAAILMRSAGAAAHVGLCIDRTDFLHACETAGSVVRERLSDHRGVILGYYVPREAVQ